MTEINKKSRRVIRKRRSNLVKGTNERPRVVLSESNLYLRVQAIDDTAGHTLLSSSSADFAEENNSFSRKNENYAKRMGELFADKLKKEGKEKIVFDRNSRPYHGKVKVFCEAMRKMGINF
jgi:large subunit ribosomal protein L18